MATIMACILFFTLLFLDQGVKLYVETTMLPGESISVIASVFHITYVLNPGAAFGILAHQRWFFLLTAIAIIVAFFCFYPKLRREPPLLYYGCVSLAAGAVGNLIDRLRIGYVIDYFDFCVWPVFNVADVAIVAGVAGMIISILFGRKKKDA
ncbi:signal peptidase II [Mitsuokella sp. oral taxon 131]|uniref:signal peptidase II n=1 Tax=Mitsuokella sp. oral taxon 131 TaxID=1321780 RepID=UPI0003ADEE3C|nr:signal peptidase II [Mitsuokella sp. oral taxon 131]ERL25518.1 signal peptidase II [Mitsuokella sp. oral taxon 131 str. W9106]